MPNKPFSLHINRQIGVVAFAREILFLRGRHLCTVFGVFVVAPLFFFGSPQFAKRYPLGRFLFEVAAIASTKASFQLDEDGRRVFSSKKKKESGKIWEIAAVRTFGREGREVKGGGRSTLYPFREKKTSFFFFKCRGENREMVEQGKKIASWTHWTRNFYIHST